MSARTDAQVRSWLRQGSRLFAAAQSRLDDEELSGSSALPGWTRKHVLAHVAGNAEGLLHLVHWAATGEESPMYVSAAQRNADIELGARRPPTELRTWATLSGVALDTDMTMLSDEQWQQPVRVRDQMVPAFEIRWLRARELMVHAVDLDAGIGFGDLPQDFLVALLDDIAWHRSGTDGHPALALGDTESDAQWTVAGSGGPVEVTGPLPDLVAYLAGRPATGLRTRLGGPPPALPDWL